jgi:hypothetical protein
MWLRSHVTFVPTPSLNAVMRSIYRPCNENHQFSLLRELCRITHWYRRSAKVRFECKPECTIIPYVRLNRRVHSLCYREEFGLVSLLHGTYAIACCLFNLNVLALLVTRAYARKRMGGSYFRLFQAAFY